MPNAKHAGVPAATRKSTGEAEKVVQKAVELALAGNVRCIQLCLDRLLPRRNGRPVDFSLPAVNDVHDVVTAMAAITTGVSNGDLTVEEAGQLAHILEGNAKVLETHDLASRIEALESQNEETPMRRDIRRRLEKLESRVPRQPTEQEKIEWSYKRFLMFAVAFYLGDPAPEGGRDESVADTYARVLGYPSSYEFRKALEANDGADLNERVRLANSKLLEKFGVTWEHEWGAIVDACKRMEAGLSESYKQRLHGSLHETIRWDCLASA